MFQFSSIARFSLRKYSTGLASVMLGICLLSLSQVTLADEMSSIEKVEVTVQLIEESSSLIENLSDSDSVDLVTPVAEINETLNNVTNENLIISTEVPANDLIEEPVVTEGKSDEQILESDSFSEDKIVTKVAEEVIEDITIKDETVKIAPEVEEFLESTTEDAFKREGKLDLTLSETDNKMIDLSLQVNATSAAIGDDYPWKHVNIDDDEIDPWNLFKRYCTSFVAYRLSSVNKFELPPGYGHAGQWGYRAQREGYTVDMNPVRGAVAWYKPGGTVGKYGHVAWVTSVNGDQVEIEEYNYGSRGNYGRRIINRTSVSGYIHFKDIGQQPVIRPISNPSPINIPASGRYTFTTRTGVKNTPKISAKNLDYYEIGESVYYDRKLEADGYQWISYINYRGSRSYVAIAKLATSTPVTTPVKSVNIPEKGSYTFKKRTSIQNEPKVSSPEIAFYSAGETVNYDRTLIADGHQWISYISYSGIRRYIRLT